MADRRAVRSGSRRITPAPRPVPTASATRKRVTRSASREVELPIDMERSTRTRARQTTVPGPVAENEGRNRVSRETRTSKEDMFGDLTAVEELDTEILVQDAPQTPPRPAADKAVPHHSPGAASQMSGTTAMSSFAMAESDVNESRQVLRNFYMLHAAIDEFLDILIPDEESAMNPRDRMRRDQKRMQDMQKPDSSMVGDYNYCNHVLNSYLQHFRDDHQQFVTRRSVYQKLFGTSDNFNAAQAGMDLVLYRANLLILLKDMIHSDRTDQTMWTTIRTLENQFPSLFLPDLGTDIDASTSVTGESALLQHTFELALNFRTQLAIMYLEKKSQEVGFDPDAVLNAVFFDEGDSETPLVRGWYPSALGGEAPLPTRFRGSVLDRLNEIRKYFPTDTRELEHGNVVDLEKLGAAFPWRAVILRLLDWARRRNAELKAALSHCGGLETVKKKVALEIQKRKESVEQGELQAEKRNSLGQERKDRSRKHSRNAVVELNVLDKIRALERKLKSQGTEPAQDQPQVTPSEDVSKIVEEQSRKTAVETEHQSVAAPVDDWNPVFDDDEPTRLGDVDGSTQAGDLGEESNHEATAPAQDPKPSQRPQSTADYMSLLKQPKKVQKENRVKPSIFDHQPNAVRVEWDDELADASQPTVASSSRQTVPQPSTGSKRRRPVEVSDDDDDDDDDAFETVRRTDKVDHRRAKMRRIRLETPSSSAAPTSHQPRNQAVSSTQNEPDASVSETEAPEMTELAPPVSSYIAQLALAHNVIPNYSHPSRKKKYWTEEETEALIYYMPMFTGLNRWVEIMRYDRSSEGRKALLDRDPVKLKDKARVIAGVGERSGTGPLTGFEGIEYKRQGRLRPP